MKLFLALSFLASVAVATTNSNLGRFQLTSDQGKKITLKDFKGSPVFLSFIFTRCPMPEMCPLTIQLNRRLAKEWSKKYPKVPLKFVIVTLDPEFDSPKVLAKYKKDVGLGSSNFVFVTGDKQPLSDLAAEFNVIAFPSKETLSHNLKSALLGPNMETIGEFKDNEWKPEDVLKTFKTWSEKSQTPG